MVLPLNEDCFSATGTAHIRKVSYGEVSHNSLYESAYYRDMVGWLERNGNPRPARTCIVCGTENWYPAWEPLATRVWKCATCDPSILREAQ